MEKGFSWLSCNYISTTVDWQICILFQIIRSSQDSRVPPTIFRGGWQFLRIQCFPGRYWDRSSWIDCVEDSADWSETRSMPVHHGTKSYHRSRTFTLTFSMFSVINSSKSSSTCDDSNDRQSSDFRLAIRELIRCAESRPSGVPSTWMVFIFDEMSPSSLDS